MYVIEYDVLPCDTDSSLHVPKEDENLMSKKKNSQNSNSFGTL